MDDKQEKLEELKKKHERKIKRQENREERDKKDYQLNHAIDMVRALGVYGERFNSKPVVKKTETVSSSTSTPELKKSQQKVPAKKQSPAKKSK